jgi:KDO2-lipid IV(A) lauroyltransferase
VAKNKPYRFFVYLLARCVAFPVYLLPRRVALALARGFGNLGYFLVARQRNKIFENLRQAYGDQKNTTELKVIARKVFENAAQTAVEILQFPKLNEAKIDSFVDLEGTPEYLRSLLKEGKGIISLTAHIGNWELLAGALCLKGIPMTVIGRKIYYEPYNRWIVQIRESVKMRLLYRDQSAREIIACLKKNEMIGILPDQDIDSLPGIWVDFFGRPAYTLTAPVKLALKTGSPIIAGFLVRLPGDRYRLAYEQAIRPVIETTFEEAVKKYTIQWMQQFERIIRQYPDQWMWMHDRWKTKPSVIEKEDKSRTVTRIL